MLGACCLNPWTKFPIPRPPDHTWSTGSDLFGEDVYSWDCVGGYHVVIRQCGFRPK
jgi:hypothetical protein